MLPDDGFPLIPATAVAGSRSHDVAGSGHHRCKIPRRRWREFHPALEKSLRQTRSAGHPVDRRTRRHGNALSAETVTTEYLAKPFSPPMLRTRVRAWLARTIGTSGTPIEVALPRRRDDFQKTPTFTAEASASLPELLNGIPIFSLLTADNVNQFSNERPTRRFRLVGSSSGRKIGADTRDSCRPRPRARIGAPSLLHVEGIPGNVNGPSTHSGCLVCMKSDRLLARHSPDPLTGLPGRRAFHELYRRLTGGSKRRQTSVLLLDVSHLKEINPLWIFGRRRCPSHRSRRSHRIGTSHRSRYGG